MVVMKRVNGSIWRISSTDPQELAQAKSAVSGGQPNPEGFPKDKEGRFYSECIVGQFGPNFPWDAVSFDGFGKTYKALP